MTAAHVLVVDDKAANLLAMREVLAPLVSDRVRLLEAASGEEALRLVLRHRVALAILDVQMPVMDGYELAALLRSHPETRDTPLIFVTAVHADSAHQFRGYATGAVDFIAKPFDPDMLRAKASIFLDLDRRTQDLQDHQRRLEIANASLRQEILRRQLVEAELSAAKDRAEAATRVKSEFLANMSHEIRTPLNGLMGMMQLLMATGLDAEQREMTEMALRSGSRLTTLLSDILDLSRIEADRLPLRHEAFALDDVLQAITETFGPGCRQKGVPLRILACPGLPQPLRGDETRLRQVLFNFVSNALKFTDQGEITLEVSPLAPDPAGRHRLLFVIRDTGPGIPAHMLDAVFDPFTQADGSFTRKQQGAGLGLAIAKRLVSLMHGSIAVDSEAGHGAAIHLSMPFEPARLEDIPSRERPLPDVKAVDAIAACLAAGMESPGRVAPAPRAPGRVLLAEDEPINRLSATRLLERAGFQVHAVENGALALAALREEAYDCVVMDVQMPELDGVEATRRIRAGEAGADRRDTPIVAMTAHAMAGDREAFLAAGMDGYVEKPASQDMLRREVERVQAARRRATRNDADAIAGANG